MDLEKVVPIKEIEDSLAKILSDMQGKNKTRACLFNLIIYTKENTREKYIHTVIQKIVERFPCRIILFIDKGTDPFEIRSTISVIEIKQGESLVYCDCIQFELSNRDLKQIPFLTLPHLMTDLPTYLLWAEDPIKQDPSTFDFQTFCSRVILDSEASENLTNFAKTLLAYQLKTGLNFADLNWARTESFRDLLSSLFFIKSKNNTIENLNAITITFNQTPSQFFCHTKIQAIYLALWLAIKLKLNFRTSTQSDLMFKKGEKEIPIHLIAGSHPNVTSGRILALEFEMDQSEHYLLKRKEKDPKMVTIYRSEKDFCEVPSEFLLDAEDSGASLVNEIFHQEISKEFFDVLQFIGHHQIEDFCE